MTEKEIFIAAIKQAINNGYKDITLKDLENIRHFTYYPESLKLLFGRQQICVRDIIFDPEFAKAFFPRESKGWYMSCNKHGDFGDESSSEKRCRDTDLQYCPICRGKLKPKEYFEELSHIRYMKEMVSDICIVGNPIQYLKEFLTK